MIATIGHPSEFETHLLTSIKDLSAKNIEFENVCFEVGSIKDADGRMFVRKFDDKSRWFDLFGTPEKAAQTFFGQRGSDSLRCGNCPAWRECKAGAMPRGSCIWENENNMLEWLKGDAE